MSLDLDAIADVVALAIKDATAPLLLKIAALEELVDDLANAQVTRTDVAAVVADAVAALPAPAKGDPGPIGPAGPEGTQGRDGRDGQPGGVGRTGDKGADGKDGKDGIDGLGWDELEGVYDDKGRLTLVFKSGDRMKSYLVPSIVDSGVWQTGVSYEKGEIVSFGGSAFIAQCQTTSKPETDKTWRLMVKRGRDSVKGEKGDRGPEGKPGKDGRPW